MVLRINADYTVVDLACGLGHYTAILASLGAESVYGYDISPKMVEAAKVCMR